MMRKKLLVLLTAVAVCCSLLLGGTAVFASGESARGFGMSVSEWNDTYGQAKETEDGIVIGADASLKAGLNPSKMHFDLQFVTAPAGGWYAFAFTKNAGFDVWTALTSTPVQECFVVWLWIGETNLKIDLFAWKDVEGTMTKVEMAMGDELTDIAMTDAFSFDLQMTTAGYEAAFRSGETVEHVYTTTTHVGLAELTPQMLSNGYQETYLNIASYVDGGAIKELKFTSIQSPVSFTDAANWRGEDVRAENGAVVLGSSAQYERAIDVSSKYLRINLNLDGIIGDVDAWVGLGFGATKKLPNAPGDGLNILFRNQGAKLGVQTEIGTFGAGELVQTQMSALGDVILELEEQESGVVTLTINHVVMENTEIAALSMEDLVDANGRLYVGFASYVQGGTASNLVTFKSITTDPAAKQLIYMKISNVPESGAVGQTVTLPTATVVQYKEEVITATIAVTDPAGNPVTPADNAFVPEVKGNYTVTYTATDSEEHTTTQSFTIAVVDPADSMKKESFGVLENWNAPYGGLTPVESGMQAFAHSYYKLPIPVTGGALRASFHIDGLWDGLDTEIPIDAWVAIGFMKTPAVSAPGDYHSSGLYVRLNNKGGKLLVSVTGYSPVGEEIVAVEDPFVNSSSALGDVTVELQKDGDDYVRLFVNGKEMVNEGLKKVYYSDIVNDAGNCYLSISAYDSDVVDATKPNLESRCLTLTGLSNEKTEAPVDAEAPVITVTGMPEAGTVGTQIVLPLASVTDNMDSSVSAGIKVVGPDGKEVAVVNRAFTPQAAGKYTVTYTAADTAGNAAAPKTFDINVTDAEHEAAGCGCGTIFTLGGGGLTSGFLLGGILVAGLLLMTALLRRRRNGTD